MPTCFVPACKTRDKTKPKEISLHRFPQHMKKIWLKILGQDTNLEISHTTVICSKHFNDDDFETYGERKKLKKDAVPTLNIARCVKKIDFVLKTPEETNLEEDMDNYYEFHLMGRSTKKRMKRHIVPHLALGVENKGSESSVSLDPLDISQPSTSNHQEKTTSISSFSPITQPEVQPAKPTLITSLPQTNVTLVQPVNLVQNRKYVLIPVESFNSGVLQNVYMPSLNNTNYQFVLQPPNLINNLPNINSPAEGLKQLTYVPNIPTRCGIPLASCVTQKTSDESILPDLNYHSNTVEEVQIKQEESGPGDSKAQQEKNLIEDSGSTSDSYDFTVSLSTSKKITEIMHNYSKSPYKTEELYELEYDLRKQMRSQRLKEKRLKKRIFRLIKTVKNLKETKYCCVGLNGSA